MACADVLCNVHVDQLLRASSLEKKKNSIISFKNVFQNWKNRKMAESTNGSESWTCGL